MPFYNNFFGAMDFYQENFVKHPKQMKKKITKSLNHPGHL